MDSGKRGILSLDERFSEYNERIVAQEMTHTGPGGAAEIGQGGW